MFEVAVIGAGRIGRIHARNVAAHPALHLKAIVDPVGDSAAELARALGSEVSTFEAVLADPNVKGVVIASPTDQHLTQTLQCIAAGKAVLCEKPLDQDLETARGAAAQLGGDKPLLLGFNRRFDRHFGALKQQLEAGRIGALESLLIVSHDPAPPPVSYVKVSGGLFKDMAIHDFDMARFILGEEIVEVYAAAACLVDPAIGEAGDVDTAKTTLKTASGRLCVISNSRRSGYGYDQRLEAYGQKGLLKADNVLESTVAHWGAEGPVLDAFQNFFLDRYAEAYRSEIAHFADIVAGKAKPMVGYDDAVRALELAEAAAYSVATGQVVRV
ncbi:inositol 2-dehydrogenase [Asticcacaulis sp.]|uniref:inositol 2-dehydrogenase n=1 Tax=Asticcacaulis sp. TaxID=1872648 RepID=UPI0026234515|nr:inositol 2-dehydrogenase [Asticcacaulis sp.]